MGYLMLSFEPETRQECPRIVYERPANNKKLYLALSCLGALALVAFVCYNSTIHTKGNLNTTEIDLNDRDNAKKTLEVCQIMGLDVARLSYNCYSTCQRFSVFHREFNEFCEDLATYQPIKDVKCKIDGTRLIADAYNRCLKKHPRFVKHNAMCSN